MPNRFYQIVWGFVFLSVAVTARAQSGLQQTLQGRTWKLYVEAIYYYQAKYPRVYRPLEWIRLDRLPETEFLAQVEKFGGAWDSLEKSRASRERETTQLQVSQSANRSLETLWRSLPSPPDRSLGTFKALLAAIPPGRRLALTPLDPAFLSSALGQKIKKELAQKTELSPLAITLDEKSRNLNFEGLPPAWLDRPVAPRTFYRLSWEEGAEPGSYRFQSHFSSEAARAGPDLQAQKTLFRGTLFNEKDTSRFPFGKIPQGSDLWVDETGSSHFAGDGHNHGGIR